MITASLYNTILQAQSLKQKLLAVLLDPEKFDPGEAAHFLRSLPISTTHIFIGGSTVPKARTEELVKAIKLYTAKPIILFPGDPSQITPAADGLLFLSLLSGRNPEYLIELQIKAVPLLKNSGLEVISTAYILVDGGNESAVARVTNTKPLLQENIQEIVDTAKAGEFMGSKLVYLEAGSGAMFPVNPKLIEAVKKEVKIPLIVGGGIRTERQMKTAYDAGADMLVMGTVFEK